MSISIIDTDIPLSADRINRLWDQGVRSVGRYLNRRNPAGSKVIKPPEAHLFAARGMRLFLIYEFDGRPAGGPIGTLDGEWSLAYAPTIGAPTDGSAFIAYTVDYDAPESHMPAIRSAFQAFKMAVAPKFQVWAYASGAVCAELYEAKLIAGRWLTMSGGFRGTKQALAAGAYEMRQALDHEVGGIDVDPDNMHVAADLPGFIPFAPPPAKPGLIERVVDAVEKKL